MDKQELINELKKEIEATKNVSNFEEHVNLYGKGKRVGLEFGWKLAKKLDEPEITEEQAWKVIERANHYHIAPADVWKYKEAIQKGMLPSDISKPELPVIPKFVADWVEKCKDGEYNLFGVFDYAQGEVKDWIFNEGIKNKKINLVARAWLDGYTIEPPKTLQVIVKNYDSTVFTTELPKEEAIKLIKGWKEDEILEIK